MTRPSTYAEAVARWSTCVMEDACMPMEQDVRPTYAPEPDDVAAGNRLLAQIERQSAYGGAA